MTLPAAPRRKPRLWIAGVVLAAVALGAVGWGLLQVSWARCFAFSAPVVCRVETAAPLVALTFDDGPTSDGLAAILPALKAYGAHATFFLIGREAAARPDLVAQLLAAGHEVGDHSYTHRRMVGRTAGFYERELGDTEAVLRRAGAASGLFRPPYGKKLFGLPQAARRHGLTIVMWDVEDPATNDPRAYADQVVAQARPGSIILVHAMYGANATARAALPMILDGLAAKGLKPVSVGELMQAGRRG
jgi:peptidoglycan/xylan/chitin deacetylase (PgdA/CDA1 family)